MKTLNENPENRYLCEARVPGKKSHEFPCVDGEAARAVCDAMGWELIRVYAPGGDSDRPADKPVKGERPLSAAQKKALVTEASRSYRTLRDMGVVTDVFDDWRHAQVWACVRREGLTACLNSHYKKLLAHFRSLRGAPSAGQAAGGRQSREGGDTLQRREQVIHQLGQELVRHARIVENPANEEEVKLAAYASMKGGVITEAYLMAIAKGKNPGQPLVDTADLIKLPASRLEQLLYTIRNRIAAREGRGESAKRNKSQRPEAGDRRPEIGDQES